MDEIEQVGQVYKRYCGCKYEVILVMPQYNAIEAKKILNGTDLNSCSLNAHLSWIEDDGPRQIGSLPPGYFTDQHRSSYSLVKDKWAERVERMNASS